MTIDNQEGPLTPDQLQAIWEGAVDPSYSAPLILAGEGNGFEVYTQAFEQIARLSRAVDYTTQALYILPWSGQSGEPASGEARAQVALTFTRAGFSAQTLILKAGQIFVDEIQNDFGPNGSVPINTGRRYILLETLTFMPGDQGPLTVTAIAAKPGYGYNNPLPDSLTLVENPGTGLNNVFGTLTVTTGATLPAPATPILTYTLTAYNETDMFVPSNIGQYVLFTSGANQGQTALIATFISPDPLAAIGSAVTLVPIVAFESFGGSGRDQLQPGASVTFWNGTATIGAGMLVACELVSATGHYKIAVQLQQGTAVGATHLYQPNHPPTATTDATVDVIYQTGILTAEAPTGIPLTGGAGWRVLDWVQDWQLTCTNAESPTGGKLGMLDLVGRERNLPRSPGEGDDAYRERVATIADVVTPNAIKRALYKSLGALPWCYRETINGLLPGVFYDRGINPPLGIFSGGDPDGDFYDNDTILWTCTGTSGTFLVGEPVQYLRQIPAGTGPWLVQATGTFGGFIGSTMKFVRKTGHAFEPTYPYDVIVGQRSGAATAPTDNLANDNALATAWQVYLDYTSFRAYFVVEVPVVNTGEFGFAYDDHPRGGYDFTTPYLDFYDGYPVGSPAVYLSAYNQLNKIRAGGVSFDLFLAQGPCV